MKYLKIQPLMQEFGIRPKKSLGQNFLTEAAGLDKVIEAAEIKPEDQVLEIGPGLGSLSYLIAQMAASLIAVEIDAALIPPLEKALSPFSNHRIIHGDILKQDLSLLNLQEGYLVVANIPYYISSAIIRHLLTAAQKPRRIVLTVQKEVAQRVCAKDGKQSLLSLSVKVFGEPSLAGLIPAGAFLPAPEVDSAVLLIDLFPKPIVPVGDLDRFFKLAKAGFSQKRKTLKNALGSGLPVGNENAEKLLKAAGIDPQRRAETLGLDEWAGLVEAEKAQA